jgi:hypothetical protein
MSASRQIHERNLRAKQAREEERRERERLSQLGQEFRSRKAETVRLILERLKGAA